MASIISESEKGLIVEFREQFRKKFVEPPSEKLAKFDERDVNRIWNDDLYALSFVHWKKEVVKDAVDLAAQALEWRKQNEVTDVSVESIGEEYVKRGVVYIYGRGLDEQRVLCLIARLQTKDEKEKMRKVFMFWLERLQRNEPGKHVTFILDTYKTAMSNVDLGMIKFIIDSFSIYFPDLLERIIILDMPWIMNAIWNIVKQWMSEEQRSKVVFCSRKDLHKYVATDQRPTSMAGTVDWTFSYPPFPDDLPQDHDFKDDPMNVKMEKKPEASSATSQPNGDIHQTSVNDITNNNKKIDDAKTKKIQPEKKISGVKIDSAGPSSLPSTSDTVLSKSVKNGPMSLDGDRTSTPVSSKLKKTSSQDGLTMSAREDDPAKQKRHNTTGNVRQPTKLQPNVSFKSIAPHDETRDEEFHYRSDSRTKVGTDLHEIALGNLLVMSPVSELNFALEGERLEGYITIRNPNPTTEQKDLGTYVAYKVKTTSPERYHVKPSVGIVPPGDSVRIRIYVTTGNESSMPKDRFLLLYKKISVEGEELPSHSEIIKFWKQNSDKSAHSEHRVRVKVDGAPDMGERKQSEPDLTVGTPPSPRSAALSFHSLEEPSPTSQGVVNLPHMQQQIALLNNKITRLESDSRWMRRRMRHTMALLFVVIVLMFLILYEITMVSYKLSSADHQSICNSNEDL